MLPAILFDPVSRTSRKVELAAGIEGLRLTGDGVGREVPLSGLRLGASTSTGTAIHLVWEEAGQEWAVSVTDPAARTALPDLLPPPLRDEVRSLLGELGALDRRGRLGLALVGFVFLVLPVLALLLAFAFRHPLLDAVLAHLPPAVDRAVGEAAFRQAAGGRTVEQGPLAEATRAIGGRLAAAAAPSPFTFSFAVVRDPSVNAFAVPGGFVAVHTGLLAAARTEEEVAGVLAHEVGHVIRRHSMRQLVFRAGLAGALQLVLGSPEGAAGVLVGTGADLTALAFSREQEHEADLAGVDLLRRARLPPDGLAAFFARLAAEGGSVPPMLSTHPASEERARALQAAIARQGAWVVEPLRLDWEKVRAEAGGGS